MNPKQIENARHALGLPNENKRSYRNRFVTGPGSIDYLHWMQMVTDGHARRLDGSKSQLTGGDDYFWLTTEDAIAALEPGEKLDQEDFPGARP